MIAAYLWAQIEEIERIQGRRKAIWEQYRAALSPLAAQGVGLPQLPAYATNNGHMFYLVTRDLAERTALIGHLKTLNIHPVFHYLSLHTSPFYAAKHDGRPMPWSDHYTDCLVRLPLYYELSDAQVARVNEGILEFYRGR